jgi:7-cyano-7-deazaguanine synthase
MGRAAGTLIMKKRAVVLLSGGLDSATTLAICKADGFAPYALSFRYGQRHATELVAAKNVAAALSVIEHRILDIDLGALGGSALTDLSIAVPDVPSAGIPITYVPARNTVFLAFALAWCEVLGSTDIYIGVNAVDYSGYPDCRPEFIAAFETLANLATRAGVEGNRFAIHAPLISLSKAEIIRSGQSLGVDFSLTVSCYNSDDSGRACGRCDSCRIRRDGFISAQIPDPTVYI